MNAVTTTYALDLNAPVTQVLYIGTNSYIYGLDPVSQHTEMDASYFLTDALRSARQLSEQSSAISLKTAYDPYGVALDRLEKAKHPMALLANGPIEWGCSI